MELVVGGEMEKKQTTTATTTKVSAPSPPYPILNKGLAVQ